MNTSCENLTFISDTSYSSSEYYASDLSDLMRQDGAVDLKLKLATCLLTDGHGHTGYDESTAPGYQHKVVIAIDDLRNEILTIAALPCPPHCTIKAVSETKTTFLWYRVFHVIGRVYVRELSAALKRLIGLRK